MSVLLPGEPWSIAVPAAIGASGWGLPPGQKPADDPRVEASAQASRELVAMRDAWLDPPGATAA
jgi:hypothetical protein